MSHHLRPRERVLLESDVINITSFSDGLYLAGMGKSMGLLEF